MRPVLFSPLQRWGNGGFTKSSFSKDTELINSIHLLFRCVFIIARLSRTLMSCLFLKTSWLALRAGGGWGRTKQSLFCYSSGKKKIMSMSYFPFMNSFLPWRINMWESWVLTYKHPRPFGTIASRTGSCSGNRWIILTGNWLSPFTPERAQRARGACPVSGHWRKVSQVNSKNVS